MYSTILLDVSPEKKDIFTEFDDLITVFTDTLDLIGKFELKEGVVHGASDFNESYTKTFGILLKLKLALRRLI